MILRVYEYPTTYYCKCYQNLNVLCLWSLDPSTIHTVCADIASSRYLYNNRTQERYMRDYYSTILQFYNSIIL